MKTCHALFVGHYYCKHNLRALGVPVGVSFMTILFISRPRRSVTGLVYLNQAKPYHALVGGIFLGNVKIEELLCVPDPDSVWSRLTVIEISCFNLPIGAVSTVFVSYVGDTCVKEIMAGLG